MIQKCKLYWHKFISKEELKVKMINLDVRNCSTQKFVQNCFYWDWCTSKIAKTYKIGSLHDLLSIQKHVCEVVILFNTKERHCRTLLQLAPATLHPSEWILRFHSEADAVTIYSNTMTFHTVKCHRGRRNNTSSASVNEKCIRPDISLSALIRVCNCYFPFWLIRQMRAGARDADIIFHTAPI